MGWFSRCTGNLARCAPVKWVSHDLCWEGSFWSPWGTILSGLRILGFDVNVAGCSWGQPGSYYGEDGYGNLKGNKRRAVPHLENYYGSDTFLSEALTIEAKQQISTAVKDKKPFFLDFAHYAVHAPFQSDPRFRIAL